MACLLAGMQVFLYISDEAFIDSRVALDSTRIEELNARLDSLLQLREKPDEKPAHGFNPNFLTDFRGFMLGMSPEEIDRLLSYREDGKFLNSVQEFQEVTGVSDSLLSAISPQFRFPDFKKKRTGQNPGRAKDAIPGLKRDLNRASPEELREVYGVGTALSKRIVAYRNYLGGYTFEGQLKEVYNLPGETAEEILRYFEVKEKPRIKKVNVNQASFREILALPYVDYELTRRIVNFRDSEKVITDLSELKKIDSFPLDKFDRIALYLLAE